MSRTPVAKATVFILAMACIIGDVSVATVATESANAQPGGDRVQPSKEKPGSLKVGDTAPALKASKWLQGEEVKKFEPGRVYVIEFWATWCGPCIACMPDLAELQAKYRDRGLRIIAFTARDTQPGGGNTEDKVVAFVKKRGPKLPLAFTYADNRETFDGWMKAAGRDGIPCSFVVDRAGRIAYIGHAIYLGVVLPKVLAGDTEVQAFADQVAQELSAVSAKLQADPRTGLDALADFEAKYPSMANNFVMVKAKLSWLPRLGQVAEAKKVAEVVMAKAIQQANPNALFQVAALLRVTGKESKELLAVAIKAAKAGVRIAGDTDDRALVQLAETYRAAGEAAKATATERAGRQLHEALLLPPAHPREASLFVLRDGKLAMFHDDRRRLVMSVSADKGRTWGKAEPLRTGKGEDIRGNRTSPVRLKSGAIGLFHTHSPHVLPGRDGPLRFRVSRDEGKTWSDGVFVDPKFAVQRNGTARVLASGRIVAPVFIWLSSLAGGESESEDNSTCFSWTYYSDDEGATWKASDSQLLVRLDRGRGGYYSFEEPCIEELGQGRLIMFGRTELGRQYVSYSKDQGRTWSEPQPGPLASAYAPALLARIPKTGDLLAIWNQVSPEEILSGRHRQRLTCAVSGDEGKTWQHFRNLESRDQVTRIKPPPVKVYRMENYKYADGLPARICYPSVAFLEGEVAICYDYGEVTVAGKKGHTTKLKIVPLEWLYGR